MQLSQKKKSIMISDEIYSQISPILEERTRVIWKLENENRKEKGQDELVLFQCGFPINNCYQLSYDDKITYWAFSDSFVKTLSKYETAMEKHPKSFGTGDAQDVIDALYKESNSQFSKEEFVSNLIDYGCCYVLYKETNDWNILRLDLFRLLQNQKKNPVAKDFTGGVLHLLKHFSKNKKNLSIGKDINDVNNISEILKFICQAFVECVKQAPESIEKNISIDILNKEGKNTHFAFYYDVEKDTYFINTVHIKSKK